MIQFKSNPSSIFVSHQIPVQMKKIVLIIIFISITLVLTLTNVGLRKDSTNIDIKIQNNEDDDDNPCKSPGGVCMTYDKDGNPVFYAGLSLE